MEDQCEIVEFELGRLRERRHMVCDGPEVPSAFTTMMNYIYISGMREVASVPYISLTSMGVELLTVAMTTETESSLDARKKKSIFKLVQDLGPESRVSPILSRNVDFEPSHELSLSDFFEHLRIPLLHCWVIHPDDALLGPNIQNYSYGTLQKYSQTLEKLREFLPDEEYVHKRRVIQNLLDAHNKQLTSHGYASLCEFMDEDKLAVLYWDNRFHVLHKQHGDLLLLETSSSILKEYPEARWKVFEEVDTHTIYLNDQYFPANSQPNYERAMSWHQSKACETKPEEPEGSGAEIFLSKGQKRRLKKRLKKEVDKMEEDALNRHDLGEGQQEDSTAATSACSDEKLGHTDGYDPHVAIVGHSHKQGFSAEAEALGEGHQMDSTEAASALSDNKQLEHTDGSNPEATCSQLPTVGDYCQEENESMSLVGERFYNFLLVFNDGTGRFKDDSTTHRVPFFEGIVEAMKFTGSPMFYVPFKFIEMHDTILAGIIQNNYPSISKDLTDSVCKYLAKNGVDIVAQLNILHLPEPRADILHLPEPRYLLIAYTFTYAVLSLSWISLRIWIFLSNMLSMLLVWNTRPHIMPERWPLVFMHVIVDKFKEGRCFGGNWDESKMMVSDHGSKFSIQCEDQQLAPGLGYLDLCKFEKIVLQRFKNIKGRLPLYFKELEDDFLLIHDSINDPNKWERFLLLISYPFALAAPIVRSTFVLDIYRAGDSESSGKDYAYSPLNIRRGIHDWRDKATAHWLFKQVYDHRNFGNEAWTSVYTFTKWVVSHWSLFKFARHFVSHVLRYTRIMRRGQQVQDLTIVDLMLGRQLGKYIAQSIRFFIFNCDLHGLFSTPWRYFVASDCMDKPKQSIGIKKFEHDASKSAYLVSSSTSHMKSAHCTGWAITHVGKDLSVGPLRQDALIANVDLADFAVLLRDNDMEVAVETKEDLVHLTIGPIIVYKSFREAWVEGVMVADTDSDPLITVEGTMCDEFHAIFELVCVWLRL